MVFKDLCVLVLWTEVASASEGLTFNEIVRKYLKNSLSELYTSHLQKLCFIPRLFSKVLQVHMRIVGEYLKENCSLDLSTILQILLMFPCYLSGP